ASIYQCGTPNSLPNADEGMANSSKTNDTRVIRGVCPSGSYYENGRCQCATSDAIAPAARYDGIKSPGPGSSGGPRIRGSRDPCNTQRKKWAATNTIRTMSRVR